MEKIVSAQDLPELRAVMDPAENASRARHVSFESFLKLFNEEVHGKIRGAALGPGITHVVCFENLDMWSSQHGHRTALTVGDRPDGAETPTFSLRDVLTKAFFRLGDVPSRFEYPVAYASVEALRETLPGQESEFDAEKRLGG